MSIIKIQKHKSVNDLLIQSVNDVMIQNCQRCADTRQLMIKTFGYLNQ
jgi:hypothetical protein